MTKNMKLGLTLAGVGIAVYWGYHRFIKKDKYTGAFLGANGMTTDGNPAGMSQPAATSGQGKRRAMIQAAMQRNNPAVHTMSTPEEGVAIPNMDRPRNMAAAGDMNVINPGVRRAGTLSATQHTNPSRGAGILSGMQHANPVKGRNGWNDNMLSMWDSRSQVWDSRSQSFN